MHNARHTYTLIAILRIRPGGEVMIFTPKTQQRSRQSASVRPIRVSYIISYIGEVQHINIISCGSKVTTHLSMVAYRSV